jgi:hypothetical protein
MLPNKNTHSIAHYANKNLLKSNSTFKIGKTMKSIIV